jgi:hypothetical protein
MTPAGRSRTASRRARSSRAFRSTIRDHDAARQLALDARALDARLLSELLARRREVDAREVDGLREPGGARTSDSLR